MRERSVERVQPLTDSGLAAINFLSSTNKANHYGPIGMTIQAGDQELGFGLTEIGAAFLAFHEGRGLFQCPCSLRFIKDRDMFYWSCGRCQTIVSKMVNVLNEGLDLTLCVTFFQLLSVLGTASYFIASQRFLENGNQGTISREENTVEFIVVIDVLCCRV